MEGRAGSEAGLGAEGSGGAACRAGNVSAGR